MTVLHFFLLVEDVSLCLPDCMCAYSHIPNFPLLLLIPEILIICINFVWLCAARYLQCWVSYKLMSRPVKYAKQQTVLLTPPLCPIFHLCYQWNISAYAIEEPQFNDPWPCMCDKCKHQLGPKNVVLSSDFHFESKCESLQMQPGTSWQYNDPCT